MHYALRNRLTGMTQSTLRLAVEYCVCFAIMRLFCTSSPRSMHYALFNRFTHVYLNALRLPCSCVCPAIMNWYVLQVLEVFCYALLNRLTGMTRSTLRPATEYCVCLAIMGFIFLSNMVSNNQLQNLNYQALIVLTYFKFNNSM
eukprot:TRINITY_DN5145_c0_g1_i1.p1 TRINITY_DN5145_c0_g1~~TRINITY_DN5145_c0_g1_i1.p1  ORF type:complete len:144 (-),score=17.85 TRINITY_DN5145_c0_g1_i1:521-952(-)